MRCATTIGLVVCIQLLAVDCLQADNWPQWRGPQANGVARGGPYPIQWSADQNIEWKFELPGLGASTPVIWENRIFITGGNQGRNSVLCLDRQGKKLWESLLDDERQARNRKASGANSSPVTDGQHVFVYFKSGTLACLDFEGKVIWQTNLQERFGEDTLWWDLGTSPVLTQQHVIVACVQSGPSYLVAFDKASGEQAWKVDRNVPAPGESAQAYTTPLVLDHQGQQRILVLGADHVTCHDAASGATIWKCGNLNPRGIQNYRCISSPVLANGLVIAPYSRGGSLTAIRLDGQGDVTESHVAWSNDGPAADVPCPVVHEGRLYTCTDRGKVAQLDLTTGKVISTLDLPRTRSSFSSSPVLAHNHLYLTNEDGTTFVVKLGSTLEQVARNELNDFAVATPIFVDGKIYLRTDKFLHCIAIPTTQP